MKLFVVFFLALLAIPAFAIDCDCEVMVYSPLTGTHALAPNKFKTYELEVYSSYALKNQLECRETCRKEFEKDMPSDRLVALLTSYGQSLIEQGVVGYNCTGLTTLKFPVRVKASLGRLGLGNVADFVQVVSTEELCF